MVQLGVYLIRIPGVQEPKPSLPGWLWKVLFLLDLWQICECFNIVSLSKCNIHDLWTVSLPSGNFWPNPVSLLILPPSDVTVCILKLLARFYNSSQVFLGEEKHPPDLYTPPVLCTPPRTRELVNWYKVHICISLVPAPCFTKTCVHQFGDDLTDRVTYQRLRHGVYVIHTRLSEEFGQGALRELLSWNC